MSAVRLVAVNDETPRSRRASSRSKVLLSAIIRNAFGEQSVKIRDVSATGAMIQAVVVPPVGRRLLLSRGSISVTVTVVWAGTGRYGVQFHEILDEAQMLIPIAQAAKTADIPQLGAIFSELEGAARAVAGIVSKH